MRWPRARTTLTSWTTSSSPTRKEGAEGTEALARRYCAAGASSRSGSMPQRPPPRELVVEGPAVGAGGALVVGRGALQRHASRCCRRSRGARRPPRADRTTSAGVAASSARLSSTGRAPGPASWISVGATQRTGPWARSHWRRAGASSARGARRSGACAPGARGPASIQPAGRNARWSRCGDARPGITSSQNRPP